MGRYHSRARSKSTLFFIIKVYNTRTCIVYHITNIDGGKVWQTQERLPPCDLRTLLSRYVDIAAPASQAILALLAAHALADADKKRLQLLATVFYYLLIK